MACFVGMIHVIERCSACELSAFACAFWDGSPFVGGLRPFVGRLVVHTRTIGGCGLSLGMVRVKTMLRRDAALLAAFNDLVGDSRRRVLIGLMDGKGLRCIARTPGIGEALGREIARELAADGLTRVARRGKIVLTADGKRAALAALQPLKSAVLAGASQDNDDLF